MSALLQAGRLDHAALVRALLPTLLDVGQRQLRLRAAGLAVEQKADLSPVTEADRLSEGLLLQALGAAAPGVPVVAEEEVAARRVPELGRRFFLVDPIDGTREFIERRAEFTINVALVENGHPVFGIILAPALGEVFATLAAGHAAWTRLGPDGADGVARPPASWPIPPTTDRTASEVAPLAVWTPLATRAPSPDGFVVVGSRSHPGAAPPPSLAKLPVRARRAVGSSLKFCLIARGDADLYPRLGATSEWDTAAGQAILEAAGGAVLTLDGAPLVYGKADEGFANPHFVAWGRRPVAG